MNAVYYEFVAYMAPLKSGAIGERVDLNRIISV